MKYDHKEIEKKWQEEWKRSGLYRASEEGDKKCYVLDMFPYPSGEGLHVGHPKGYIATDIYSRYKRMHGYAMLHPMGWDAFGLPAENFAIKNKVHPRIAVEKNIARYKEQLSMIGFNYDWEREINTTDSKYYKWTQWIFLQLLKKGLAYQSYEPINWCPSCQTGLANEDLDDGRCERCDSVVEKRPMRQWVLKITDYADRLLHDLDELNEWPAHIKESQRNWIGRSEGAEIDFAVVGSDAKVRVFTTRPDTLFGATYMVLAPEHILVQTLRTQITNLPEVEAYIAETSKRTEIERTAEGKEKTGVELKGVRAINPATKEEIPIYIADYVLAHYGTGAIMAVPAHDERDYAFAKKFGIETRTVVEGGSDITEAYTGPGILSNSGAYNGLESEEAKKKITEFVGGKQTVTYKLRDWVFSRQRYWGEPIPIIHCETCGAVPVPERDLPVKLPEVESYEPTGTGESPLAAITDWVNTTCPSCGGAGKRETNTMPQWAGSSWYYLRFMDPHNDAALVSKERERFWAPVDVYVGGAEHATRHLIYARFWHKFLFDIGVVHTTEPFMRLHSVGLILAEDGRKMSKRYGNVVNPDDIVATFGADTLRVYEMFMGPFEGAIAWNTDSMIGSRRFLERIWRKSETVTDGDVSVLDPILHKTIQKVGEDIEAFKFNTAISQLMILLNETDKVGIGKNQWKTFLTLLAPFAPHMAEELWHQAGNKTSVHAAEWPTADVTKLVAEDMTIAIQVYGKVRATMSLKRETEKDAVIAAALAHPDVKKWLREGEEPRVVYVPGRLVSVSVGKP